MNLLLVENFTLSTAMIEKPALVTLLFLAIVPSLVRVKGVKDTATLYYEALASGDDTELMDHFQSWVDDMELDEPTRDAFNSMLKLMRKKDEGEPCDCSCKGEEELAKNDEEFQENLSDVRGLLEELSKKMWNVFHLPLYAPVIIHFMSVVTNNILKPIPWL